MDVKRFLRKDHTLNNGWGEGNVSATPSVNRSIGNNSNNIFSGVSSINNNNNNSAGAIVSATTANNITNSINNPSSIYPRSMNSNTLSDWASFS